MRSLHSVDIFISYIFMLFVFVTFTGAELEQSKNRRGGTSGLYAFPRVGRSDPRMANNFHETDIASSPLDTAMYSSFLEEYEEYPKSEIKRASLIAFPRVGRTDAELRKSARLLALEQALSKRTGPSATSGLWFGPRLGKRSLNSNGEADPKEADLNEQY